MPNAKIVDGTILLNNKEKTTGTLTGAVELPVLLPGSIKVRLAIGDEVNGANEFAAVTYVDGTKDTPFQELNFLSVNYGPGQRVLSLFPEGRGKWRIYTGYVVTSG
ncbi:MAG: hypothetical protein H0T76_10445 [Nannocystis sp.]|nr:hypothetical protein [Nannocystis sp.]MBA3546892.1 hypothetical protein [Nannocystis sp.]